MKKIYTLLVLWISISPFLRAQPEYDNWKVGNRGKIIGKNIITNKDIVANEYVFSEKIHDTYIDTNAHLLTVRLRGTSRNGRWLNNTGNMAVYDLQKKQEVWVKEINYYQDDIHQYNDCILQKNQYGSCRLDIESGERRWKSNNTIFYIEPTYNVGIGFQYSALWGPVNILQSVNLRDGNSGWKREINREYGCNNILHLNDTTLLVTAAGLHTINIKNGKGWDYNALTGDKDYKGTIATNVAGVTLGILTGTFLFSTGYKLLNDLVSNVLVDSTRIYIAAKESMVALDHQGKVIWEYVLPNDLTSKSSIFFKDSVVYMVNHGYAFLNNRQIKYGKPFIAAVNKRTGEEIFFTTIEDKEQIIRDCLNFDQ